MRTLIIPDIHHHTDHADYWLATQRYDRVVCREYRLKFKTRLEGHDRHPEITERLFPGRRVH